MHRPNGAGKRALNQAEDVKEKRRPMQIVVGLGRQGVEVLDGYAVEADDSMGSKGVRDGREMCACPSVNIVKIRQLERQPDDQQSCQRRQYLRDHVTTQLAGYPGFGRARVRADRNLYHRSLGLNTSRPTRSASCHCANHAHHRRRQQLKIVPTASARREKFDRNGGLRASSGMTHEKVGRRRANYLISFGRLQLLHMARRSSTVPPTEEPD